MSRGEAADTPVVTSRRRLLELVSGATVAGLAGCGGDGGGTDTPATATGANTPTEEPPGTPTEEPPGTPTDAPTDTATATPGTEPPPWDPGVVRTMSFNIRYDNPDDDPPWPDRRDRVVGAIRDVDPDVVGLQEALPGQFSYVREQLDGYEWYGIGRRGEDDGEHVPLGWRTDRFEAIETDTFWLSETPDVAGSVGWDADLARITSRVDLENRETGTRLRAYNTHLSHVGSEARHNSSRMIRERVEDQILDGRMCTVLGDFNFTPGSEPHVELTRSALVDSRTVAATVEGPEGTFHGWSGDPGQRIDYVFLPINVAVDRYRTLPPGENGAYRSDHLPVVADIDRDGIESTFG
jgi:endonuclease/exonuclease/phosphatase family metal-dependent hydrolase